MTHRAEIFNEGSFMKGDLSWGWQCYTCHAEEIGYGNATTAREAADNHMALS